MKPQKGLACLVLFVAALSIPLLIMASGVSSSEDLVFPLALDSYHDHHLTNISDILLHRIQQVPMNLVVSVLFLCAIIHTFCTGFFRRLAQRWELAYYRKLKARHLISDADQPDDKPYVSFGAEMFYLLSEVEIVFGLWVIPVFWSIVVSYGWHATVQYMVNVDFTEAIFVVVIMTLASSRPIERFSENVMKTAARLGKGSTAAWWFAVLTLGPLLGSFITEPAAMTISAILLAKQFYRKKPSRRFAYATISLLFVNVSVGGTLSNFAAPPVLMVAEPWNWGMIHMLSHFGWKAVCGIVIANSLYFFIFRSEFEAMERSKSAEPRSAPTTEDDEKPIPFSVILFHVLIMVWTVFTSHYPFLFIPAFFIFLGFRQTTAQYQNRTNLKSPMLVGAFLAGLVVHGGLQGWWIAPILSNLGELTIMLGATALTAFNDNAAIAYLSTQVPDLTQAMKYAVVAGAVTGGGLTVIANAPNPAGVAILKDHFKNGVLPLYLALGAAIPTVIMGLSFMLLP